MLSLLLPQSIFKTENDYIDLKKKKSNQFVFGVSTSLTFCLILIQFPPLFFFILNLPT